MKKFLLVFAILVAMILSVSCSKNSAGLEWSTNRSSNPMSQEKAVEYCKNLNEGGHNDWRLPNIGELRTVIKNCPKTESGGACKCSEKWNPAECLCEIKQNNGGYYSKLGDDNIILWSSSSGSSEAAWKVDFSTAGVFLTNKFLQGGYARCVR